MASRGSGGKEVYTLSVELTLKYDTDGVCGSLGLSFEPSTLCGSIDVPWAISGRWGTLSRYKAHVKHNVTSAAILNGLLHRPSTDWNPSVSAKRVWIMDDSNANYKRYTEN